MHQSQQVLIVDDDVEDAYLLHRALRKAGVEDVTSVTSVEEASKFISGLSPFEDRILPDIIFTDLKMAGASGVHLLTWLKRNPLLQKVRVIIYSGSSNADDRKHAISSGGDGFFCKTSDPQELKQIVAKVLNLELSAQQEP